MTPSPKAVQMHIQGAVQGVGFRPHVHRVAASHGVQGWVRNDGAGVLIHAEGDAAAVDDFVATLRNEAPPTARVQSISVRPASQERCDSFAIQPSTRGPATVQIAPDLAPCEACLRELLDPADRHYFHPYNNCTRCGPRYSILLSLPYDRASTTMSEWAQCSDCQREFSDPDDRRFHAQPVACSACGPKYVLVEGERVTEGDQAAIQRAAERLAAGQILAIKGVGGYHLACDARRADTVARLRAAKVRKEKPFALLVRDLTVARHLVKLGSVDEQLLSAPERPIVLAPASAELAEVAPDNLDLGVMLPSTPLHELLFAAGAPEALVMTSANQSSEPIAYRDEDAKERLSSIVDGFLVGERPIARRVDDSIVRAGPLGPMVLRRSRGLAPSAVARSPVERPVLALGGDLKNTVSLVVGEHVIVSQHLGDLRHLEARRAYESTVHDLVMMYELEWDEVVVAHDAHPDYASTQFAAQLPAMHRHAVQHHRAHVASVLAEKGAWDEVVVAAVFDGSGYGDDGTIWGGEWFVGSLRGGLRRATHLRRGALPGGDAAAAHPVQAAAGYLHDLDAGDLASPPFNFPLRYELAQELMRKNIRVFPTTSMGRLFDSVAALLGFTREITFEAQAAIWVEHLARRAAPTSSVYPFPCNNGELDYRPLLEAVLSERRAGRDPELIAASFHEAVASAVAEVSHRLAQEAGTRTVVLSGGVFQNQLLLRWAVNKLHKQGLRVWTNTAVPVNDGGLSLGQAVVAALEAD